MSTIIPMLSAPEYLGPLVSAFHMGMDQAVFFYASNPRMAVSILAFFIFIIYYLREVVKVSHNRLLHNIFINMKLSLELVP